MRGQTVTILDYSDSFYLWSLRRKAIRFFDKFASVYSFVAGVFLAYCIFSALINK